MKNLISALLVMCLVTLKVSGQTTELDSLEKILKEYTVEDTMRVNILNQVASKLEGIDIDKTLQYAEEAKEIAIKIDFTVGESKSLHLIGVYYSNKGNYDKALDYFSQALKISQEIKNNKVILKCFNSIGVVFYYQSNYSKALEYFKKALNVAKKLGDKKEIIEFYTNIGVIYSSQSNYPEALKYYEKSLRISKEIGDKRMISDLYNNIGAVYNFQDDYPKALKYYEKSLQLSKKLGDKRGVSILYNNIGIIYKNRSAYPRALEYYQKSLKIKEELGDKRGVSNNYFSIGNIYLSQSNYINSLEYYQKSLKIKEELEDKQGISNNYLTIGGIYMHQKNFPIALDYYYKSLKIKEELGDKKGEANCLSDIGNIYKNQNNIVQALEFYQKSLDISIKIGVKFHEGEVYKELASLYLQQKEANKAYTYGKKAYKIAKGIGGISLLKESAEVLFKSSEALNLYKEAYKYHVVFKTMNDSIFNENNVKKITSLELQYKYDKEKQVIALEQAKKDARQEIETKDQNKIRNLLTIGILLAILLVFVAIYGFIQKRKANTILAKQKLEIENTNEELNQINEELNTTVETVNQQKAKIEKTHQKTQASINYASRIQQALLPSQKLFSLFFPEHFILFKPKDIVSGDFYYFKKVNDFLIIAVADCTGHGVPGAFVSLLGISFLNEIVVKKEVQTAAAILEELRKQVKTSLKQTEKDNHSKDGMDIALCLIDTKTNLLQFSGAYNPLYIIRNNDLIEIKATKNPIGIHLKEREFENHEIQLQSEDSIYLFSDGYIDQFGGEKGMKFMSKKFKNILIGIAKQSSNKQKEFLSQTLKDWKGNKKQIDDITVLGFRI